MAHPARVTVTVSLGALCVLSLAAAPEPWRASAARIAVERDVLAASVAESLCRLRERLARERPERLGDLEERGPAPLPWGYGIVPRLLADGPEATGSEPWENRFSLKDLASWAERETALTAALAQSAADPGQDPADLIQPYRLRAENFRRIDEHAAYHDFWQPEARRAGAFFARKNELLAAYRAARAPGVDRTSEQRAAAARRQLEEAMYRITPTAGLALVCAGGVEILAVPIATDIADEAFLGAFVAAVEHTWNESAVMVASGLRLELGWDRRTAASLYPEGAPAVGSAMDTAAHRRRFGEGTLVLTSGARSTHSLGGAIFLGPAPLPPRTLAHELGHLLGFDDEYLRAYEGSPDDADGVVWVEVGPFPESLMASPGSGRVTEALVRRLIEAYRRR